ncbi:MAG: hypothetical protein ACR2NG_00205 [Acidimicrobiia bacterium]
MFRFAFIALALIALGALLANGFEGVSLLVLAPLLILAKVFFLMLFFGVIGGFFWRNYDDGPRREPWSRRTQPRAVDGGQRNREELFEEWHRVAHAREEVDTWVEDLD